MEAQQVDLFDGLMGKGIVKYGIEGQPEEVATIYDLIHIQLPSSAMRTIRDLANQKYPVPEIDKVGGEVYVECVSKNSAYFNECLGITLSNVFGLPEYEIFYKLDEVVDLNLFPPDVLAHLLKECKENLVAHLLLSGDDDPQAWAEFTHELLDPTIDAIKKAIAAKASGYVYLLKSASGYWKIGRTVNPEDRIKTFSVKLPFEVEYEHLIPCQDHVSAETSLHSRYASKRVNGEWFCLSETDINEIKAIEWL